MSLQRFEYYLKGEGLKESTATEHVKNIERFKQWVQGAGLTDSEQISYSELLSYVQHLKGEGISIPTINIRLTSLRKYYGHLKQEGIREVNPAKRLHIKGALKRVTQNPLSFTELEQLYMEYAKPREFYFKESFRLGHQRRVVILGLMIWQGIHSGYLGKIEISHVKLDEGIIYIPAVSRSKSRELKLDSRQIIALHRYITEGEFKGEKLFDCHPNNTMQYLLNELKGINPVIQNVEHIRASVILHWIKMYGKRQVQYMAGHKWITSTERYELQEMDSLGDLLTRYHPFA